ncbi:hypothetical protein MRX96_033977 [Rhipicephalus microplus]
MHRGANGARTIILPLPKSDFRSACLGFAGGTHIDILLADAPAIMGFRTEKYTVKTALWNSHRAHIAGAMCDRRIACRANGACAIILPLPKSDCRSAFLGFAGGTHIDILILNAPAIMGFRIERDTVKFANYKGAETITTDLLARWLRHTAFF